MQTNLLKKLYAQLQHFGLNSQDWIIKPVSQCCYIIYNQEDPSFRFFGQTDRQMWTQIWID